MDLEARITHLYGPEEVDYAEDELMVVCLVRDARPYVKSFVEHYFSMGVKHLAFLDNGSTDGTVEALRRYENVTVLRTGLPFKEYQGAMKRHLIHRFGKQGRWVLYVDQDELFDYPYSDVVSLGSFLRYLSGKSYTAFVAQMLEMFPENPVTHATEDEPLKESHRFYDISNITRQGYHTRGDASNVLDNEEIEIHRNGILRTVFGQRALLTKHPLIFLDGKMRAMDPGAHWVGGARVADITGVLFHYKFIGGFQERVARAVEEGRYADNTTRYDKFFETLERNPETRIKQETAQELEHVNDLVDAQFLVVSEDYAAWMDAEERKSAPEGGPRRLAGAFSKASAEARTQARVARVLERRVGDLEDSLAAERRKARNRPEAGQRREVDVLENRNRHLENKNTNLEKKIRNLERQIMDIQSSRSWRLLGGLGRVRDRLLQLKRRGSG